MEGVIRIKLTIPILINLLIVVIDRISNQCATQNTRAQTQRRTAHHAHAAAATAPSGTAVGLLLLVIALLGSVSLLRGISSISTLLGITAVSDRWSLLLGVHRLLLLGVRSGRMALSWVTAAAVAVRRRAGGFNLTRRAKDLAEEGPLRSAAAVVGIRTRR